jgi:hypothetical protein
MNLAMLFCDAEQVKNASDKVIESEAPSSSKQNRSRQEDMLQMHKPAGNSVTTRREDKV